MKDFEAPKFYYVKTGEYRYVPPKASAARPTSKRPRIDTRFTKKVYNKDYGATTYKYVPPKGHYARPTSKKKSIDTRFTKKVYNK